MAVSSETDHPLATGGALGSGGAAAASLLLALGIAACAPEGGARGRTAPSGGEISSGDATNEGARIARILPHLPRVRPKPFWVDPVTGLGFPLFAGGLRFQGVHRYRSRALGFSIRYQNTPDIWADIYVYPGWSKKAPERLRSAQMVRHFQQVEGDIATVARRGIYQALRKHWSRLVRVGEQALWEGVYSYTLNGRRVGSRLYLLGYRGHFVKVRFTYAVTRRRPALRALSGLLGSLVGAMQ